MKNKGAKVKILQSMIYPLTMIGGFFVLNFIDSTGISTFASTSITLLLAAIVTTYFELKLPYETEWLPTRKDVWNDAIFMIIVQVILPKILAFAAAVLMVMMVDKYNFNTELWPGQWPIALQVTLMILIADFFRYWLHRFSHENSSLWKLHAVHHSPEKLYWLNVGRFHPVEKALQYLADALPFVLLGVKEEVLALYLIFYGINGFFQHCNIDLKLGILNYVISGPELHRWHHSCVVQESNKNYGNNLIVWDLAFGTYLLPKERTVEQLGLINRSYPDDFGSQMQTPFSGKIDKTNLPLQNFNNFLLNTLLNIEMIRTKWKHYKPFIELIESPNFGQNELLEKILNQNENTEFGKRYNFSAIKNYDQYKSAVPIFDYEDLRSDIEKQDKNKIPVLTSEIPFMYNQTSGTSGKPKYIPLLKQTIKALKVSQNIFTYAKYKAFPEAFYGKIFVVVSPSTEGYLPTGTPFGSASGHIYESMPKVLQPKFVVPKEVFEIDDYELKYFILSSFMLSEKNITYLGTANPSTFQKILLVINEHIDVIKDDIRNGICSRLNEVKEELRPGIEKRFKKNAKRAQEIESIINDRNQVSFADLFPYLKILATWTGGSCGIAIKGLLQEFPSDINIIDYGYLASELRGTINIDFESKGGIPNINDNFFEFSLKEDFENEVSNFITLDKLEIGKSYYLFVTNSSGLYRYDMNDIIKVTGKFKNIPTFEFIQKGKGSTSITGEKLYVNHVIESVLNTESKIKSSLRFYIMVADEEKSVYDFYIEPIKNTTLKTKEISKIIDESLQKINLEYKTKRLSGRLAQLKVHQLKENTFDAYKSHYVSLGQREGQFKPQILQYKKELSFDIDKYVAK